MTLFVAHTRSLRTTPPLLAKSTILWVLTVFYQLAFALVFVNKSLSLRSRLFVFTFCLYNLDNEYQQVETRMQLGYKLTKF
jgi:hypothetical protein